MKKAFGLIELLVVVGIILAVYFTCFNNGSNPVKNYVNEQVMLKNQTDTLNRQVEDIKKLRDIQIQQEQQRLDEEN